MNDSTVLLFVYGSLKRGLRLHSYLETQNFLAEAVTEPSYRLFNCGDYPGLVKVSTKGVSVKGEVFEVSQACLSRLDVVEAVDEGLYVREQIHLAAPTWNLPVEAYFYARSVVGLPDCGSRWPTDQT